ncbi:MAG TPA: S9 family peptidase [Kiloniellales bacterium]|nr:S9 family peptidase [Kiloniellales bacterium]
MARRQRKQQEVHGVTLLDDYAWLRDENWQKVMREPERLEASIHSHLEAENRWVEQMLEPTSALQNALFDELRGRIKEDDSSVPDPDGPWSYYTRFRQGGQHPLLCRRPRSEAGNEQLLLDGDLLAEGKAFFELQAASHSPNHRLLAYAIDETGSEYCEIRFRDLRTGHELPERLQDANGAIAWSRDGRFLFYVVLDSNHRPCKVLRHEIGRSAAEDQEVYREEDPGFFVSVGSTTSRRYIVISAHDHVTSELRLIDAEAPEAAPRLVRERVAEVRYSLEHDALRRRFLILTNRDGAEDFKVMEAPEDAAGAEQWREFLPHDPGCLRLDLHLLRNHLVLLERIDALPRIRVLRLTDGNSHEIAFQEAAYALGLLRGHDYETTRLRFVYSSPTTPQQTWDYELESRQRTLRKQQEVPSGHKPSTYIAERLHARARDGELVPITILRRRDTPVDGSAPLLLYGYGAYGLSIPAGFQVNRFSLIDRGFIHATAHIRGGTDKGWSWYRKGKLSQKQNSFSDFIDSARYLVAEGYAAADKVAIQGGSAGGLLVGAVLNQAPELFRAAVLEVPFVDVLNTMLDDTLPLTPPEWNEWGNPLASSEAFETIRSYCPYQNIRDRDYPHILATAGLTDPRVTYWEPAKWVAKLRATKTNDSLLMLKTYMQAGHAGAAGRFEKLREVALVYAFLLQIVGAVE